jgi:hypothetical protein
VEVDSAVSGTLDAINNIFSNIFSSVDNSVYEILDKITFVDTSIIENDNFKKLMGTGSNSGILMVCNALILGILLFYVTGYLISHLTYSKIQKPSQFFFKAIIFIALMNNSYWICSQIINIVSLISSAIRYIRRGFIWSRNIVCKFRRKNQ